MPFDRFNPFRTSITPSDEEIINLLNKSPVSYKNKTFTLSQMLKGDSELAFEFLREQVCYTSYRDNTQIRNYSNWLENRIPFIRIESEFLHKDLVDDKVADLIESAIIKEFIASTLAKNSKLPGDVIEYKKLTKDLFNNLIDKISPSTLNPQTWSTNLHIFIRIFASELDYVIETLTELCNNKIKIPLFSYYKQAAECVGQNSIPGPRPSGEEHNLTNYLLSLEDPRLLWDIKVAIIILCIKNPGRHNLVMHIVDTCNNNIFDYKDITENYKTWSTLIYKTLLAMQKDGRDFPCILKSLFNDKNLHPGWHPLLRYCVERDVTYFHRFALCEKESKLRKHIETTCPGLTAKPHFPVIKAMHETFGHSYHEYSTDIEWTALNEHVTPEKLEQSIKHAENLPSESVPYLLKILVVREIGIDHLSLYKELINRLDIPQYQEIPTKNIKLLEKLPKQVKKMLAEAWVSKIKAQVKKMIEEVSVSKAKVSDHPEQYITTIRKLIKDLNDNYKGKEGKEFSEFKGILNDHLPALEKLVERLEEEQKRDLISSFNEPQKSESQNQKKKGNKKSKINRKKKATDNENQASKEGESKNSQEEQITALALEKLSVLPTVENSQSNDSVLSAESLSDKYTKVVANKKAKKAALKALKESQIAAKKVEVKIQNSHNEARKKQDMLGPQNPTVLRPAEPENIEQKKVEEAKFVASQKPKQEDSEQEEIKQIKETESVEQSLIPKQAPNMLHSFKQKVSIQWQAKLNIPGLFPFNNMANHLSSVLVLINTKVHLKAYQNKPNIPVLVCHESVPQFLFDCSYSGKKYNDPTRPDKIYLYLHLPNGIRGEQSSQEIQQWIENLKQNGETRLQRFDRDDYVQFQFVFRNTQIYLTFSTKKLQHAFTTIELSTKQDPNGPIGYFRTPPISCIQTHPNREISFNKHFPPAGFFDPRTWSSLWAEVIYLCADGYLYSESFLGKIMELEVQLFTPYRSHILRDAANIFFFETLPRDPALPALLAQHQRGKIKIPALDPIEIAYSLIGDLPPEILETMAQAMKNEAVSSKKNSLHY